MLMISEEQNHLEFAVVETYADQKAIDYHMKSDYYAVRPEAHRGARGGPPVSSS